MIYFVAKTGMEIFDLCRAYGLATLLDATSPEEAEITIVDSGCFYLIEQTKDELKPELLNDLRWLQLFEKDFEQRIWNKVFLTYKDKWYSMVIKVKEILTKNFEHIIKMARNSSYLPSISTSSGETLSGPLDPSAFKGLRGKTRGDYIEGQTKVDKENWALASLGGAISGRYITQRGKGNREDYFAIFPAPEKVRFNNFRKIKESIRTLNFKYLSVQNAAAHFSVILAQKINKMAFNNSEFSDRYSSLFYFSIIKTGQQSKPSIGGRLSLFPLIELAYSRKPEIEEIFEIWDFIFKKGIAHGYEDLALSLTEFIMHPTPDSYERHARMLLRYILKGNIKGIKLYSQKNIKEVIEYGE